jgi:hypothetical protein
MVIHDRIDRTSFNGLLVSEAVCRLMAAINAAVRSDVVVAERANTKRSGSGPPE